MTEQTDTSPFSTANVKAFFQAYHEWMQAAIEAGFTPDQAFAMVRTAVETVMLHNVQAELRGQAGKS